jgi:beta-mannosidase
MSDLSLQHPGWRQIPTSWELARLGRQESGPEGWIHGSVPGAVQLDWARAHGLPDFAYGRNLEAYEGLEDFHWLYRTRVPESPRAKGEQLVFVCGGVDYACEVRVGGRPVLRHEGLFTPFEVDVSACVPGTELSVLILPAPKRHAAPADRSQAGHVCKPPVSYGWDWHPRLIPLGLWTETGFVDRPVEHIKSVDFGYVLGEDLSSAAITVNVEVAGGEGEVSWRLLDPDGNQVVQSALPGAKLANPRLWWTHDHGEPALYTLEVSLASGDTFSRRVGFRRVRLVMAEGEWNRPTGFPVSRNHPPVTVELNGRVIFAKGSNWVNADVFPGRITAETTRPLLELARGAHFNLLRSWGGGIVNPEAFFDQCDELGLLVWQEFPLSCNAYPDDPAYLRILDQESRSIIGRVRQHPCLAIWCGGNELFNAWSRMTDQSLAVRLLGRNCFDLDPRTPFIPTAPLEGMGHGDYRFRNEKGQEVYEIFQQARNTAYSEFGCAGPSPVEVLRTFIPEDELWPPRPGTSWEAHHAFGAWGVDPTSWLLPGIAEHYFGAAPDLETMVARGIWLQCAGYQAIFEEARRQKPGCAMALNWCFNEPWPCAAGNSLVNWPANPKPAYYAVRAACRPVLASARFSKFQWRAGETFSAEIWLLNDAHGALPGGEIEAELIVGGRSTPLLKWEFPGLEAGKNLQGPCVQAVLPSAPADAFQLVLKVAPNKEWTTSYSLSLLPAAS